MKKFCYAAGIVAMLAAPAAAADIDACANTWAGPYAGLHAGYVFGDTDTVPGIGDVDISGLLVGGLVGYNYQNCEWVIGIEGDIGLGESDGEDGIFDDIDLEPNGHLRARLGWDQGSFLPFAAAGLALADVDASVPPLGNDSNLHIGLSIGGGVDIRAAQNLIIRAEYLFDWYSEEEYNFTRFSSDIDLYTHTVRGALIWQF